MIHDVFLNDALDGPLPIAYYSAALFRMTEGRAYSAAEYRVWLTSAGLTPAEVVSTLMHCGVLPGVKHLLKWGRVANPLQGSRPLAPSNRSPALHVSRSQLLHKQLVLRQTLLRQVNQVRMMREDNHLRLPRQRR